MAAKKKSAQRVKPKAAVPQGVAEFPFKQGKSYRVEFLSGCSSIYEGGALLANRTFEKTQVGQVKEVATGKVIYSAPE